jgi:hypothetical protein
MKAQKRENESRSKVEEARRKNSVMRVLNRGSSREQGDTNTRHGFVETIENSVLEFSSKYSPEIDTLPPDAVSPTISPMHQASNTPTSIDTLNTIKAMQTLNALSQMNQMNHYNTLNHLSLLSMNSTNNNNGENSLNSPPPQYTHTVINHFNTNLNTFNTNPYNLSPELSTPMTRFPPQQQLFLPVTYNPPMSPSQASPYNAYMQHVPVKDYTSASMHPHLSTPQYSHYPQVHANLHSHSHSTTSLLHPSPHTLIPNPTMHQHYNNSPEQYDDPDEASITGGGQM